MPATAARTFTLPRSFRLFTALYFVVLLSLLPVAFVGNQNISTREAILVWSGFALLMSWGFLEINATRVTLDTSGVAIYQCFGRWLRFRWSDIEDLDCSPRVISIAVRGLKGRVKLFLGARGYSLESFDELQDAIAEQAMPRLLEAWNRVALPVVYTYPGLTRGEILGYLVAVAAVSLWPLVFAIAVTGFVVAKLMFAMLSLGLLSPFFLRDWRRAHGAVRLAPDHVERISRRNLMLPWKAITELIISDPAASGFGWIHLVADDGRRIRIPRSSRECGAIRHILSQKIGVGEDYDREQW